MFSPDIEAPQYEYRRDRFRGFRADENRRNEHQQVIVERAFPADHDRTQGSMPQYFGPDQENRCKVPTVVQEGVGDRIHRNAGDIDPRKNRRADCVEDDEEHEIDEGCNLDTALQHAPEWLLLFDGHERHGSRFWKMLDASCHFVSPCSRFSV